MEFNEMIENVKEAYSKAVEKMNNWVNGDGFVGTDDKQNPPTLFVEINKDSEKTTIISNWILDIYGNDQNKKEWVLKKRLALETNRLGCSDEGDDLVLKIGRRSKKANNELLDIIIEPNWEGADSISRDHAFIIKNNDALMLVDAGSRNGIYYFDDPYNKVDTILIEDGTEALLGPGIKLHFKYGSILDGYDAVKGSTEDDVEERLKKADEKHEMHYGNIK